jgi:hypothetical protein
MRYLVVGLVLAGGVASADPDSRYLKPWERENSVGVTLEGGGGWQRVDPNGITYRAEYLRFAPQVALSRWLYIAAAVQYGHIYGSSGTLDGQPYIPPGNGNLDESSGSLIAAQALVGAHALFGIVSGGFEVAPTGRWTSASSNAQYQTTTTGVTTIEFHARADVWATPNVSAGLMVGMDIASVRDFEAGLQVAFHFAPYDAMNR